MRKWIKKLSCGLLCAATIGGLASCKLVGVNSQTEDNESTEELIEEVVKSYINEHKDELKGEKGDTGAQGEKGDTGKDSKDGIDNTLPNITIKYYCGYSLYMQSRKFSDKHKTGIFYNQIMSECPDIYELDTKNLIYLQEVKDTESVFGHKDYVAYYIDGSEANYELTEVCSPNYDNDYSKKADYVYDSTTGEKYTTPYTKCHNCGLASITDKLTNNSYITSFSYSLFEFATSGSNNNSLNLPSCYGSVSSHTHTIYVTKKQN